MLTKPISRIEADTNTLQKRHSEIKETAASYQSLHWSLSQDSRNIKGATLWSDGGSFGATIALERQTVATWRKEPCGGELFVSFEARTQGGVTI